ncbi:MAG: hypothetical protein QOF73_1627 [Thermomicrobiales bacterium]|nr:hypothetical protein [Thermomicrobiales bacterium]
MPPFLPDGQSVMTDPAPSLRLPEDLERLVDPALLRKPDNLTVACYTFPHFHRSAYNDRLYAPGWSEYVLMRGCQPWFPGHNQPRTPMLGELDERDPATWDTYLDLARQHGVDTFIFDWYWYGDRPVLHEALEEGYLNASNRDGVGFAVMWTNHPWAYWFPTAGAAQDPRWPEVQEPSGLGAFEFVDPGPGSLQQTWRGLSYLAARYFHEPGYWHIDGQPVLVIWDVGLLVRNFGANGVRQLFAELRGFVQRLGHAGLHIHASMGDFSVAAQFPTIGVDSYGLYNSIIAAGSRRPQSENLPEYGVVAADVVAKVWQEIDDLSPIPCFPNVSPGWDDTPRHMAFPRPDGATRSEWPGTVIVVDESPAAFEALVRGSFAYLNQRPAIPPVLTIGCWNEWTEGHYLLPDTRHGFGMLRALSRAIDGQEKLR